MRLNIKNLKGQNFQVKVDHSFCFLDVKKAIKELKKVPIQKQKLVYKGKAMQDETILSDIGVKDEDNFVLMSVVVKKTQAKIKEDIVENMKENQINQGKPESKAQKIDKVGQEERFKDLDIQNICDMLGISAQQFQIILEENPEKIDIVLQALENNELDGANEEENPSEGSQSGEEIEDINSQLEEIIFTPEEEKSIERLSFLGFCREEVITIYIACEKNQELAANILLNEQNNEEI